MTGAIGPANMALPYNAPVAGTSTGDLILSFGAGVVATLIGVGSKYFMDYRVERRRLQLQERTAVSDVMGNSLGQLGQSVRRLHDRLDSVFRDFRAVSDGWLDAKPSPGDDGYFLKSFVLRLFAFLSWATIVQWTIDALPPETVKERSDLRTLYDSIDRAKNCLTNSLIIDESESYTDRQVTLLFVDTLDDVADLGLRAYQRNDKTIPRTEFDAEYLMDREPLRYLRSWLALTGRGSQPAMILARLACLRECLDFIRVGTAGERPRIDRQRLTDALHYAERTSAAPLNLSVRVPDKLENFVLVNRNSLLRRGRDAQLGCHRDGWVGRTARFPQFAGPFPYGPPPNRTCRLSRHPALW
jgi:hypothetical protein